MHMEIQTTYTITEWLSLEQVLTLLRTGQLSLSSPQVSVSLSVHSIDRVTAREMAERMKR